MTMTRRELFGFLRRRPESAAEQGTPPIADTPAQFALEAFYAARSPGRELPRFAVRGASLEPTTRVGAGPAMARTDGRDTGQSITTAPRAIATEPRAMPAGVVPRVLAEACLATTTFCSVCSERCPVPGAIAMVDHRPRIVADRCDGCGLCVQVCPAPILALEVVARPRVEAEP